jgi:Tfp pilus assembly protein PilN
VRAVNLIPSEQRAAVKPPAASGSAPVRDSAFGAYVILGLLVLAVAATALYVLTSNSLEDKKAELAQVEREAAAVQQQASALQSFADFQQLADTRESTIRGLAESRFAWAQTLNDVARVLPSDVYVNAFDGTTLTEASGSSLRGAIQAPSIQLNGCTSDQASVARLLSRLRDVPGVTRVSLAKSEAVDTPDTAAAPAPATSSDEAQPTTISEPCPDGAPPAFELVMFFERAPLSANATPNEGATSVSTTPATAAAGATTPASATGPTGPAGAAPTPTSTTTP